MNMIIVMEAKVGYATGAHILLLHTSLVDLDSIHALH